MCYSCDAIFEGLAGDVSRAAFGIGIEAIARACALCCCNVFGWADEVWIDVVLAEDEDGKADGEGNEYFGVKHLESCGFCSVGWRVW